jgi:preprotein translocase subunit SecG
MDPHHDDFDAITARLEAGRPTLSAHELDDLARRIRVRNKRTVRRKEPFMRTRFAITSMLVIGVLLSCTAGAGMALSGTSGSGSAGSAQYGTVQHQKTHLGTTSPAQDGAPPPVQPARQLATPSGSSQLPFTGLLLIPIIILGVAMLLVGLVLRSRSNRAPNSRA